MNRDRHQSIGKLCSIYLNQCCSYSLERIVNLNAALLVATGSFLIIGTTEAIADTYTVTNSIDTLNTSDANYVGSLRWAIEQAENNPGADTINIATGQTITVDNQDPNILAANGCRAGYTPAAAFQITDSLTINGNGAVIDGGRTGNTDSFTGKRIFYFPNNNNAVVNLNNLTLQNGNAAIIRSDNNREHIQSGGGDGDPCSNGGVIWLEDSTLNLDGVRVSGGLSNDGGAINVQSGTLNVNDTTFDSNFARDDGGVFDIDQQGVVSMLNSTVTNNISGVNLSGTGQNGSTNGTGGIARIEGELNLTYVTAAYNIAGGLGAFDIRGTSNFVLRNSLLVENILSSDGSVIHCDASTLVNDEGGNWADTNDCGTGINVDTADNIQLNDTLAPNGGTTPTLALANTSSVNGIIETTDDLCPGGVGADDQRDVPRAVNAGCEPGAYELQLPVPTDYGDAPNTYGDAVHNIPASPGLYLGSVVPDGEISTRTENTAGAADGDDRDNDNDEDAFDSLADIPTIGNYSLNVPLTSNIGSATLHAWIDFDRDGVFDAGEYQSAAVSQNDTSANLNWTVPTGTIVGETYARFRLTSDTSINSTTADGIATNGEVEDYPVTISIPIYDYGDAPDTGAGTGTGNYQTTAANDGAAQVVINTAGQILSIGDAVDTDDGSLQNADATADDVLDSADDEDGVTAFPILTDEAGQTYTVSVPVRNNVPLVNAYLVGYIDFNRDGDFNDPNERSTTATIVPNANGDAQTMDLTFTTPAGMTPGNTFARLRLGQVRATAEQATGASVSTDNGEIEDYQIAIAPASGDITGTLYEDNNGDNLLTNGEPSLPNGITLRLLDSNNNGNVIAVTTTDANGQYNFAGVDVGSYIVQVDLATVPDGYQIGSSKNISTDVTANATSTVNFPFDRVNISGTIFEDVNQNNVKDSFESPLSSVFVALFPDLNDNGSIDLGDDTNGDNQITVADAFATINSDIDGNYGFNAPDGNYIVFVNTNDADLVGRTYGGVTGVPNNPLNDRRNADINGSNIVSGLDYPFDQGSPPDICDAGDPTDQVNFLNNPTLIAGNSLQVGAVYRFNTVFDNVDALVEVVQFNGGATLGAMDNNSTGEPSAFQPTLNATAGNATSSVDFEVRLIDKITGLPAFMNFKAAGVDIDGDSNQLREFIELSNITSFTLDPNTTIDVTSNPPITRFESNTTNTQPGISSQAVTTLAVAQYNNTSNFRYSIGAINQGSTGALGRLNSLYIGCAERVESDLDYGDAPDTYGTDNTVGNSSNNTDPLGAVHLIDSNLFLGATVPDAEDNGFVDGTDDNGNATDDDDPNGAGTGNGDDEDNFALPNLEVGDTSYTIPAANIVATNTTEQPATLHVWIDFDRSGTFEDTEHASVTVDNATNGGNPTEDLTWNNIDLGAAGNTYARFRLTTDDSITETTPGSGAINGEVEDYQIAIASASDPGLLLIKRITAINPGQPDEIQFDDFVDDPNSTPDNHPLWPDSDADPNNNTNLYLRGVVDGGKVKPGDEVEYTIYFLSNGDEAAQEVNICDVVPDHLTYVKDAYGSEIGIGLGFNPTAIQSSPNKFLSNLLNDDEGNFYGVGTAPPANLCKKVDSDNNLVDVDRNNNDNGAIIVRPAASLPPATSPGQPAGSYGFIRFRGKVK